MSRVYQNAPVSASGKVVYVGIDVHKDTFHVTVRREGSEDFHGRIPSRYASLQKLFSRYEDCELKVAYEAGPCGFSLHDRLTADGIDGIVVPPSLIPVESGNRVKTDRRDSRKLAMLLEGDLLKRVHVLTEHERSDRELLRTRRQLVGHRSDVARQFKSKLLFHGIDVPFRDRRYWTRDYLEWMKGFRVSHASLRRSFDHLIDLYEHLTGQIQRITREVVVLSSTERYRDRVKLLRTVPGIGVIVAMEVLVELPGIERFRSKEELASYLGLTPSEYSTGEKRRQGQITHCGNKRVRTALVESSWLLIAKDPVMRQKYDRIKSRRGAKRAIVAVARTLSGRIRYMLIHHEPYGIGVCG
jgi:transposase